MSSKAATPISTSTVPATSIVLCAGPTWKAAGFVAGSTTKPRHGRLFSVFSWLISGWQNGPRPPSVATE
ncbi:hypothetical protein E2C01_085552 [Portunus trituberculatus]|uniref:Uncharacterized protein n=1 Tax=Portunus trituberculatus TaxID=210409 RepID=A0A5B7J715_PORTR|nr:hypothetical protein [Portunus trituberculatus]